MKRDCTSLLLATLLCCVSAFLLQAQESINPLAPCSETATLQSPLRMQTRSTNAYDGGSSTVYPFSDKDQQQRIYALAVNLSVTFTEGDGYFSILLEDQTGEQYLVYRDIAIFNKLNTTISLPFKSFETALLQDGVYPRKLILYTAGCRVNLEKVSTATSPEKDLSLMYQLRRFHLQKHNTIQTQIDRINDYNKKHGILWIAKQTSLSLRPYAEIRQNLSFFSEVEAYGLEHYGGGIYTPMATPFEEMEFLDTTTYPYVEYFDWSDRHGINWNTPSRWQQGTESCWAQAATSALEGYIKRYYGDTHDRRVSVLQIIACSKGMGKDSASIADCGPGSSYIATQYLTKEPIVSEEDFPFTGNKYQPCENKPMNPSETYQVEQFNSLGRFDRKEVMYTLINKGPMVASIPGHSMLLSGYGLIKPGLFLGYFTDIVPIPEDHPLCGKVYWSFKNSFGEGWGNHGYSYFVRVNGEVVDSTRITTPDIYGLYYLSGRLSVNKRSHLPLDDFNQAYDADGDGYYRWGLMGKPMHSKFIPNEQDGDDSDPIAGPMNQYGFCKELRKTDLYIRDVKQDKGVEPYLIDAPQWESPDIWVRQEDDGIEEHQNPNFSKGNRCYVYLRIHNKGIKPSIQRAIVSLYWSYASPTQWWESFHGQEMTTISNGKKVVSGGEVGTAVIPSIPAGRSAIIKIPWNLPAELLLDQTSKEMHACLLAEITEIQDPLYLVDHSDFRRYVQANNNVAQKNVHIVSLPDGNNDNDKVNITDIIITNHRDQEADFRFIIDYDDNLNSYATIKDQLEISYHCEPNYTTRSKGLDHLTTKFIPVDSVAVIDHIRLAPNEQQSIKLKTNFLVQKQTAQNEFKVRVRAVDAKTGECIGGNTYLLRKAPRPLFSADVTIIDAHDKGTKLIAHDIGEPAEYVWSTTEGEEFATGKEVALSSDANLKDVTLSVEATKDGFLDRKTVTLPAKVGVQQSLMKLYPNPTEGMLTIELAEVKKEGVITVTSAETGRVYYSITTQGDSRLTADLSTLPRGNYLLNYYDGTTLVTTQEVHKL